MGTIAECDDAPSTITFDEVELALGAGATVTETGRTLSVTWDVNRGDLEAGIGYEVQNLIEGAFQFSGSVEDQNIGGPSSVNLTACPPVRATSGSEDECTDGPVDVDIQQQLQDRPAAEVVRVVESIEGVTGNQVTATDEGIVEEDSGASPTSSLQKVEMCPERDL